MNFSAKILLISSMLSFCSLASWGADSLDQAIEMITDGLEPKEAKQLGKRLRGLSRQHGEPRAVECILPILNDNPEHWQAIKRFSSANERFQMVWDLSVFYDPTREDQYIAVLGAMAKLKGTRTIETKDGTSWPFTLEELSWPLTSKELKAIEGFIKKSIRQADELDKEYIKAFRKGMHRLVERYGLKATQKVCLVLLQNTRHWKVIKEFSEPWNWKKLIENMIGLSYSDAREFISLERRIVELRSNPDFTSPQCQHNLAP